MDPILQNFVRKVAEIARLDSERQQLRNELNTLWNGSPNWDASITQEAINSVPAFAAAGLTIQMISDVIYCEEQARQIIGGNPAAYFVMSNIS